MYIYIYIYIYNSTWAHGVWLYCVSKYMSYQKAIVVIAKRARYFHDNIYIMIT